MTFERWTKMETRVNKALNGNKNLYKLFFKTEKLFNEFNDFFTLKELLIHYLIGDEIDNLTLKREMKHFLKEKFKGLKLRKLEEEKEEERIRVIWETDVLIDEEFPF